MAQAKKPKLDPTTTAVLKRVLAMPPKVHDEMKVARTSQTKKKKAASKSRAASSKPRTA